jgi:prepilin-type N-terminal cleavage/methylation domain-containing protein
VSRRDDRPRAFTIVELIIVLVVVGVVAAVALPSLASVGGSRSAIAARVMVRDVTYARERAIATGARTWVVFNVGASSYSVLGEDPANPGRFGALALKDPANPGRTYVQTLNTGEFAGVTLLSASFDGAAELGFTWLGQPLNSAQNPLATQGTVTLTGGRTVTVQVGTGLTAGP